MSILTRLLGNSGNTVEISKLGEIFTRLQFSSAETVSLTADDVVVNIVKPRSREKMIITGLIVNSDRSVVGEAKVEIYESLTEGGASSKDILTFDIPKNSTVVTSPILIETAAGRYINAVSDDSTVNVTLLCYFVPV